MSRLGQIRKGIRAVQAGNLKAAEEVFKSVLKAEPKNPDALHFYGLVQYKRGRNELAITLIRKSIEVDPSAPGSHNNLGNVLWTLGRDDEAMECYRTSLALDPLHAETLNNIATIHRNAGRLEKAIATLRQAIKIVPTMAETHHNLAMCLWYADQHVEALEAHEESLRLGGDWIDPVRVAKLLYALGRVEDAETVLTDYLARHKDDEASLFQLAAIRGENIDRANDSYVKTHFDSFAASFDGILKRLDYRAPELVAETVAARLGAPDGSLYILDLGCGTGLCGPLIAPYKSRLVGVDLSTGMIEKARGRGYDSLQAAELQEFLESQRDSSFDVVISADVLAYLGTLERTIAGVARVLRPGGIFVATVEKLDASDRDYGIDGSGRFKHTRQYLERLAKNEALAIGSIREVILRKEMGNPVSGYLFELLSRKSPSPNKCPGIPLSKSLE